MKPVIGLGAGGHAKVVIELLRLMGGYDITGLLDPKPELRNAHVLGVPVLGDDTVLPDLHGQGVSHAFIGVGGVGDNNARKHLYELAQSQGFEIVPSVHPQAIISPSAEIGNGPTIMAGVVINAEAKLGDNVLINTGAIIEHDCEIGDHCHVATGAKLASTVRVGIGAHIGIGAIVRQSITIGDGAVIGAGAVVVKNVPARTLVTGVPARPQRMNQEEAE